MLSYRVDCSHLVGKFLSALLGKVAIGPDMLGRLALELVCGCWIYIDCSGYSETRGPLLKGVEEDNSSVGWWREVVAFLKIEIIPLEFWGMLSLVFSLPSRNPPVYLERLAGIDWYLGYEHWYLGYVFWLNLKKKIRLSVPGPMTFLAAGFDHIYYIMQNFFLEWASNPIKIGAGNYHKLSCRYFPRAS